MASPTAALRPVPTWSGPVGLAETNSTCTRSPPPTSTRPKAGPRRSTSSRTRKSQPRAMVKLMKPGPATSTSARRSVSGRWRTMTSATSRGLRPTAGAIPSATLDAKSPCSLCRGRTTSMRSGRVSRPSSSRASSNARRTIRAISASLMGTSGYPPARPTSRLASSSRASGSNGLVT